MNWLNDVSWQPMALLLMTAAIHACYQVSLSVLTLLSNHTLGAGRSNNRLLGLGLSYIAGVASTTLVLLVALLYVCSTIGFGQAALWWAVVSSIAITTGLYAVAMHFKSGPGTVLRWLPRSVASYLHDRSKKTKQAVEAFALGVITALAELPLSFAPLLIIAMLVATILPSQSLNWLFVYVFVITLPLIILLGLVGGGTKLSVLQRWREENKNFLQFVAGSGLVLVGLLAFATYGSWGVLQ